MWRPPKAGIGIRVDASMPDVKSAAECGDFEENDDVRKPRDRLAAMMDDLAMDMDRTACYRAIATRDARFDGRLFVGVKTTGIYCRPICPARTPKFENVSFYPS